MPENGLTLRDVCVLDLSEDIAGPFCTKLLAGLGAEVIKVERPGLGDVSRRAGPFPAHAPDPEQSALFLYLNTGKKSITLDVATRDGRHSSYNGWPRSVISWWRALRPVTWKSWD